MPLREQVAFPGSLGSLCTRTLTVSVDASPYEVEVSEEHSQYLAGPKMYHELSKTPVIKVTKESCFLRLRYQELRQVCDHVILLVSRRSDRKRDSWDIFPQPPPHRLSDTFLKIGFCFVPVFCLHVCCGPHVCLTPTEVRRGHQF